MRSCLNLNLNLNDFSQFFNNFLKNRFLGCTCFRCSVLPEKPVSWRTCDVPCPVDCQTSPWSEWSACSSADALEESIQTRMRVVLAAPSSGGSPCPPLIEKRSCFDRIVHGSAQDYHWHVSANWTPCQLSPEAKCGAGIATRSKAENNFLINSFNI